MNKLLSHYLSEGLALAFVISPFFLGFVLFGKLQGWN